MMVDANGDLCSVWTLGVGEEEYLSIERKWGLKGGFASHGGCQGNKEGLFFN